MREITECAISASPARQASCSTATVARRDYLDGATTSDIAAELGLSRFKVARLLDEARATGIVRIEPGHIDLHLSVTARGTSVIAPMNVVGLIVRTWLVTGLTLGAVTGE